MSLKLLQDRSLFRQDCLIGDTWTRADSGRSIEIRNPADGSLLGAVPVMGAGETERAIAAAETAFQRFKTTTAHERAGILRHWADLMAENANDLALILTLEQGKPLAEARAEIGTAASYLIWFAEEARRANGETMPTTAGDRRFLTIKQPVGVVAAITPWNFPAAMIARKVAPAVAAGCTVVVKPAPQTPFIALAMAELGRRAGLPAGVLNVVTGDAKAIGEAMTASPVVRKISFTGSTSVGKLLLRQSADTVKRVSLELGGNAPFIVFDDADIDAAVEGLMASKFRNTGQTCVCANRIFVQDKIYRAFIKKLAARVSQLKVGPGLQEGVQQGPLINDTALAKVEAHVANAKAQGAEIVTGGKRHALGGTFYEPTVIAEAKPNMLAFAEETFGPLAPVYRFKDEAEVIRLANATRYGLAAYFYSRDIGRIWRVSEALETGMVGINVGVMSTEMTPFGGVKESGIGREGSHHGLDEYLEIKSICMGGL
jgi:succinate-semialdehyde dehydrogenase/glutarate-semialdehyde dehydrogenase